MISQHNGVPAIDGTLDRTPQLTGWLAHWPRVRCEVEALLKEYERRNEQYDPHWTESIIEMMDGAISNLTHRATWLKARLEQPEREAEGLIEGDSRAFLAERQIG